MLIVTLYYRSLLSGIHHAYQVRVLLAVETQAGTGCAVPNRTVPTRTAQWKRAITVPSSDSAKKSKRKRNISEPLI